MSRYDDFTEVCAKLRKVNRITPWNDIMPGKLYHIPPIIIHDRRDFRVRWKNDNYATGRFKKADGEWEDGQIYRGEVSALFMVEVKRFNNN